MRFEGKCHCGNLEVSFETKRVPAQLELRECTCSFCRRHGATTTADPAGALEVRAREPGEVSRYRFGLRTADFMVCRICGVYVAAICRVGDTLFGTLNVNVLDERAAFSRMPEAVDYSGETVEARVARRGRAWTPAVVRGLGV